MTDPLATVTRKQMVTEDGHDHNYVPLCDEADCVPLRSMAGRWRRLTRRWRS